MPSGTVADLGRRGLASQTPTPRRLERKSWADEEDKEDPFMGPLEVHVAERTKPGGPRRVSSAAMASLTPAGQE